MGLGIQFNKISSLMSIITWPESSKASPRPSPTTPFVMLKIQVTHIIDGGSSPRRQTLRHPSKNRYQKVADSLEDQWSLLRPGQAFPRRVVVICNLARRRPGN